MHLVWPSRDYLPSYVSALRRGWSPDNHRPAAVQEELQKIAHNPAEFLHSLIDKEAAGPAITLPDGSSVPRLPGYRRWMWDGEFCGSIGIRWQRGTSELPSYCLGHVGYGVVPWKQGKGYAAAALRALLPEAKGLGLEYLELITDPSNLRSQRVILANGGVLIERFTEPKQFGEAEGLRFRIHLP